MSVAGVTRERYLPLRRELEALLLARLTATGQTAEPRYWLRPMAAALSTLGLAATKRTTAERGTDAAAAPDRRRAERAAALELAALALAYATQLDRLVAYDEHRSRGAGDGA